MDQISSDDDRFNALIAMRGNVFIHCALYHMGLQNARTQLTPAESDALSHLAHGKMCIVELGVFEGATSRRLRKAMAQSGTLWCIDPFYSGSLGFSYGFSIASREVGRSSNGSVLFVRKLSHEAVLDWRHPIDLLFIDADHSYEAVYRDWFDWAPHVVKGGIIALHDSRIDTGRCSPTDGPVRLVCGLKVTECGFKISQEIETITVFEKMY